MSLLEDVVDNDNLRKSVQNIYNYISKHDNKVNMIFNLVCDDLKNIFNNVECINNKMVIILKDSSDLNNSLDIVRNTIKKHTNDQLPDISFDVLTVHSISDKIYVKKRQNEVVPE